MFEVEKFCTFHRFSLNHESFPTNYGLVNLQLRLMVVSHKAKKQQHASVSSGLHDHYSELFTRMAALKLENVVTQPP